MGYLANCQSVRSIGWAEDQGRRPDMEDGFVFIDSFRDVPSQAFLAVFDGHGGRGVMEYLMSNFHTHLSQCMSQGGLSVREALSKAYLDADAAVRANDLGVSAGSTAVTCLLTSAESGSDSQQILYTAHVGDSRAILCRDGTAMRLTCTSDHRASDPQELKRVFEDGGFVINNRVNGILAVSRAFGDHFLKSPAMPRDLVSASPHISAVPISPQDSFLILACDGLWDVMSDQEAVDLVSGAVATMNSEEFSRQIDPSLAPPTPLTDGEKSEIISRMLVEEALSRHTTDNVTVMVVFL